MAREVLNWREEEELERVSFGVRLIEGLEWRYGWMYRREWVGGTYSENALPLILRMAMLKARD